MILELLIGQLETSGWSSALSGFCEVRGRPCAEEERVGTGRRRVWGEGEYRGKVGTGRGWAQGEGGYGERVGTGERWVQGESGQKEKEGKFQRTEMRAGH